MKALVYHRYGSPEVLTYTEVAKPAIGENEVLVRVLAAAVNPEDWHRIRGHPYLIRAYTGIRKPKTNIPGLDVAGRIEAVGHNVSGLHPGDEVFGGCQGAFAEFAATNAMSLAPKPENLTFAQAAAVPVAALTALQGLRNKGKIQAGKKVLINGASGGVGTFAVQIAKAYGAEVTGVCSTRNVALVQSLGADHVIDYTRENFTKHRRRYDLILDNVVNHPLSALKRALEPEGTLVILGGGKGRWLGPLAPVLKALILQRFSTQKLVYFIARLTRDDLFTLKDLIESGKVRPVIDRQYAAIAIPEAIRYLEQGHARGKVVINMEQDPHA